MDDPAVDSADRPAQSDPDATFAAVLELVQSWEPVSVSTATKAGHLCSYLEQGLNDDDSSVWERDIVEKRRGSMAADLVVNGEIGIKLVGKTRSAGGRRPERHSPPALRAVQLPRCLLAGRVVGRLPSSRRSAPRREPGCRRVRATHVAVHPDWGPRPAVPVCRRRSVRAVAGARGLLRRALTVAGPARLRPLVAYGLLDLCPRPHAVVWPIRKRPTASRFTARFRASTYNSSTPQYVYVDGLDGSRR